MNNTAIKLTYKDFCQIPEDLNRHEIIDGEHYVTPSPMTRHQIILSNLFRHLDKWVEGNGLGKVLPAPVDVVLSDTDIVVPDLIFISKKRLSIMTEKNIQGAPDLVVEILSPSTIQRDLGIKKTLYEKHEAGEYWVVDPEKQSIDIFALVNQRFSNPVHFSLKDQLISSLFPTLCIPLSSIFE